MTRYFCPKCKRITSETKDRDVLQLKPCIICGENTFDADYFPAIESKEEIKNQGNKWVIHNNDKDSNYGSRHAHEYSKGFVLNLDTGEVTDIRTHKVIGMMPHKELEKLKSKSRFFKLDP